MLLTTLAILGNWRVILSMNDKAEMELYTQCNVITVNDNETRRFFLKQSKKQTPTELYLSFAMTLVIHFFLKQSKKQTPTAYLSFAMTVVILLQTAEQIGLHLSF